MAGSDASDAPAVYLGAGADIVLIGEGLTALRALVRRLDANPQIEITQLIEALGGIAFITDGNLTVEEGAGTFARPAASRPRRLGSDRYRTVSRRRGATRTATSA